ncbi:MAG: hypothetical protein COV29_04395 [Candidatus Yanofskybacteria bacterium CG10_big_fil_rev_8_21_14_0_10_36_16]|uniref:SCP domain-containing protein n=1 Tax=Candidatus Yanofskybacteria bacterium CG10_big_fil_rev_8_21_14_0_10_36_16 TaxID=1975096 RepID=A0A2J0QA11_9BACT|nr:MAG: hypothetical protein COV29_04395 [Candidatus Yanofskybacteria bacterium CG10_big_fil_rev_8_21_14_0_10_36_16]
MVINKDMLIRVEKLFTRKLIVWNLVLFALVKFVLSYSGLQLATVLEHIELFDSREIITKTNIVRANNNLPPLNANVELDLAASKKLQDMISNGYFAHISPEGTTPWFWIKNSGYKYVYAGENLAIGFTEAEATVEAWFESPSHRENLLNSNYDEIGVAVGKVENLDGYSGILVVQMFGKRPIFAINEANAFETSNKTPNTEGTTVPEITPNSFVAGSQPATNPNTSAITPITDDEVVMLQYVSTDKNLGGSEEPIEITTNENNLNINSVSKTVNNAYIIYALIIAAISILFVTFVENSKKHVAGATFNIILFIIATTMPVLEIISKGAIF